MTPARLALLTLLVEFGLPAGAAAQSCSAVVPVGTCIATTSTTLTIGSVLALTLSSSATTLSTPTLADYDAGYLADNGPTAIVTANRPWRLQLSAATATWTATSTQPGVTARPNKPASDLEWSSAPGGPFAGLSTTSVDGASGGATAGAVAAFYYRTLYAWTVDTPGSYSLTVVFTLTAP